MKERVILLLIASLWSIATLSAQEKSDEVVQAIKQACSSELVKCLGEKIGLTTPDGVLHSDRTEVEQALAAFFGQHKVSGFKMLHQGTRDESGFVIGLLTAADGNYRINCFYRKTGEKYKIHQIRIDKTDE